MNLITIAHASTKTAEEGGHITPGVASLAFPIINMAIFVFFLWYFLRKPVKVMVKERKELIENEIKSAETKLAEATMLFCETENRIKNLDTEMNRLVDKVRQDAEETKERIIKNAKETAEAVVKDTENVIQVELSKAKNDLRAETTDLIIDETTRLIKSKMTQETQEKLLKKSVEGMGTV